MDTPADTFAPPRLRQPSLRVAEAVVEGLLAAHTAGTLDEWLTRHRRLSRWLARHWLRPLQGAAGEWLPAAHAAGAVTLLLRWAVGQLRPDRGTLAEPIPREAWLDRTSWRPVPAVPAVPLPDLGYRAVRLRAWGAADRGTGGAAANRRLAAGSRSATKGRLVGETARP